MTEISRVLGLFDLFDPPLSIIPISPETKLPAVRWKRSIDGNPFTRQELIELWDTGPEGGYYAGLAMGRYCSLGLVALDADNAQGIEFIESGLPKTDMVTTTRVDGGHFIYRGPGPDGPATRCGVDVLRSGRRLVYEAKKQLDLDTRPALTADMDEDDMALEIERARVAGARARDEIGEGPVIDIRGDGGQIVAPGTVRSDGKVYRARSPWRGLDLSSLPMFDARAWFADSVWKNPDEVVLTKKSAESRAQVDKSLAKYDQATRRARGRGWLARVEGAVSGSGGQRKVFYVAIKLAQGFALGAQGAFELMRSDWNSRCRPPWTDEELAHHVVNADKLAFDRGSMLWARRRLPEINRAYEATTPRADMAVAAMARSTAVDVVVGALDESTALALDEDVVVDRAETDDDLDEVAGDQGAVVDEHDREDVVAVIGDSGDGDFTDFWKNRWQSPFACDYDDIVADDIVPSLVRKGEKISIPPTTNNIALVMKHSRVLDLGLRYNRLKEVGESSGRAITDHDLASIKSRIDGLWTPCDVPKARIWDALSLALADRTYEPLRDWLEGLGPWDGVERLKDIPTRVMKSGGGEIDGVMFKKFMTSAVARFMVPGTKVDTMLFLVSRGQGLNKSTFLEKLVNGDDEASWFTDTSLDLDSKDAMLAIHANAVIEWSEAEQMKSEKMVNRVKAFLSAREDDFRSPYGRVVEKRKRRCVFVGTSNEDKLIHDATGDRRFFIIRVGGVIDIATVLREREQWWAEALDTWRRHRAAVPCSSEWHETRWWFEPGEKDDRARTRALDQFRSHGVWHDDVAQWLDDRGLDRASVNQVIRDCLRVPLAKKTHVQVREIRKTLMLLGWEEIGRKRTQDGSRAYLWARPGTQERQPRPDFIENDIPV